MRVFAILCVLFFPVVLVATSFAQQGTGETWITDVTIVSPEALNHVVRGSVLIDGERISRVERNPRVKAPSGAKVVDGGGGFLIPGLIDSHVHLASVPGMGFDQRDANAALMKAYYKQMPRSYLYFGYTTVVDLMVLDKQVMKDFREAPLHPDTYDCGEALVFANGYPMSFAPPDVRFTLFSNFIYDPKQASSIPAEYKPEDYTPSADVARVKSEGGICVKTFYERGFGKDKNLPVMSADNFAEIRKASTADGLVLMLHANSYEAEKFGVDGGVDVLAHGMWHWGDMDRQGSLPDEIKALLDRIVEMKVGYQPTFQVLDGERVYFEPDYLQSQAIRKVVPADLADWFASPAGQGFRKELVDGDASDAAMRQMYDAGPIRRERLVVGYLARRDANFVFGTDTPSGPTYGNLPGLNGYLEMQQLRRAGLSYAQILKAATINNAREFKLDAQMGTIEPGKIANLVLLKKSPLAGVDAYDTITTVWVHGKEIPRESLAADSSK